MAAAQTVEVIDPALLIFIERMVEKGFFPALVVIGLFLLVAKYGWPWQGRADPPTAHHADQPAENRGVVDALGKLDDKLDAFRLEVVQRLTRLETKMKISPIKGDDE